jgi:SAM-dependent methyltransferase
MTVFAEASAAIGAGGYDWLAIWRQMHDAERAQATANPAPDPEPAGDHWASKAARFARATNRATQPDHFMRFVLPHLQPSDTVLDIGAGAGRHAVYLAQQVAGVVAVEPSLSMRQQLEQRLAKAPSVSVRVVPERWPDADVPTCDVAICAHVVYGVREIGPFLARMDAIARRACFLLLGYRQPAYYINPFWQRLYGEPRAALPGALECLNALHQLGISAQLALLPASRYTFADEDEALADLRWRLRLPRDTAHDAALRAAMRDLLDHGDDGQLIPRNQPTHVAALWWEHESQRSI